MTTPISTKVARLREGNDLDMTATVDSIRDLHGRYVQTDPTLRRVYRSSLISAAKHLAVCVSRDEGFSMVEEAMKL